MIGYVPSVEAFAIAVVACKLGVCFCVCFCGLQFAPFCVLNYEYKSILVGKNEVNNLLGDLSGQSRHQVLSPCLKCLV